MQRFWETVIRPVLDAVRPEVVVEIGSDQGGNTENLLGFCRRTGATLHVIDPAPGYDASEWQREHDGYLVFHRDLSLNALPKIEAFDAVLIDGDHNWYTVFHELKIIEEKCEQRSGEFPVVMLHDVGWPYGRRDLYYDPETIPEEHRKPHEKRGMLPGIEGLLKEGGMNQHLQNAALENESRGGVLTAVEDFLRETNHNLELVQVPGIHGLAILFSAHLTEENAKLAGFLENLRFSPFVSGYVGAVDKDRLDKQIRQQEERVNQKRRLEEESQKLREARHELKETHRELKETRRELTKLFRWLEEMSEGASALLDSRQWKTGHLLGKLQRKVLRRPAEESTAVNHLQEVIGRFQAWEEGCASRAEGSPSGGDQEQLTKPSTIERP